MELELVPEPPAAVRLAVIAAVADAGVQLEPPPPGADSDWRRVALEESVERDPRAALDD